jgi:hypothetical protein
MFNWEPVEESDTEDVDDIKGSNDQLPGKGRSLKSLEESTRGSLKSVDGEISGENEKSNGRSTPSSSMSSDEMKQPKSLCDRSIYEQLQVAGIK